MQGNSWAKSTRDSGAYSPGRWVGKYHTNSFTGCVLQEDAFELNKRGDQLGVWWRSQMQMRARCITESSVKRQACFAIKLNSVKQCARACHKVTQADQRDGILSNHQVCVLFRCLQAHEFRASEGVQDILHKSSTIWQKR